MKLFKFSHILLVALATSLAACGGDSSHSQFQSSQPSNQVQEKAGIFSVQKDSVTVVMNGVINSNSLANFQKLLAKYPNISTINIKNCDGSSDDETNLKLSKLVFDKSINTHIMDNGIVASGGTDFFLAGMKRTKGKNTRIGVHAWADGSGKTAKDYPRGDQNHEPYIIYYQSIGMTRKEAEDFYYFTINAATASKIHWMTDAEIKKYKMLM